MDTKQSILQSNPISFHKFVAGQLPARLTKK